VAIEESEQHISIGALSEILQVSIPTIRSWEKRYGWPIPSRTAGGHRRYPSRRIPDFHAVASLRREMATKAAIARVDA
jgi:MerR family transcriptional regulator, light-induced transcriptional regulator